MKVNGIFSAFASVILLLYWSICLKGNFLRLFVLLTFWVNLFLQSSLIFLWFSQNSMKQLLTCAWKHFLYVHSSFCTSLKTFVNAMALCKFNSAVKSNFSLFFKFTFVSYQIDSYIFSSVWFYFLKPLSKTYKSFIPCNVIR